MVVLKLTLHSHVACWKMFCFEAFGSFWHLATMYGGEVVGHSWDFCTRHQSIKAINQRWRIWYKFVIQLNCWKKERIRKVYFIPCVQLAVCVFVSPDDGPWDSLRCGRFFFVKTSGLVTPSPPGVGIMTPKGSGTNGALVKWWKSEGICFPRNPKAWWDSDFYSCHGFVWTRKKSKSRFDWKASNLLAQPQDKTWLNHLLLKICEKSKHKDSGNIRLS